MRFAQRVRPGTRTPDLTLANGGAAAGPEPHRGERVDPVGQAVRDEWSVLAGAGTGDAPRTVAAAQDAVFRRYLPMARAWADSVGPGGRQVDQVDAVRAAEIGLAQAVLGWWRPDSAGFEFFAHIAIAARLDRLPTAPPP